ncbi:hypothetical protein ACLOJK_041157 [Asimina triloba]
MTGRLCVPATLGNERRRKSFAVDAMASCVAAARRKGKSSSPRGRRRITLPSPSSSSRPLPLRQVTVGKVSHLPASSLSLPVSILLCSGRPSSLLRSPRLPPPPSSLSRPLLPLLSSSARPSSLSPGSRRLRLPPPCPAPCSPSSLPPLDPPLLRSPRLPPPPCSPSSLPPLAPPPSLPDLTVSASLRPVPPPAPRLLFLRSTRLSPQLTPPPSASLLPVPPPAPPPLFLRSPLLSPPLAPPPSSLCRPLLPLLSSSARPSSLSPPLAPPLFRSPRLPLPPSSLSRPLLPLLSSSARPSSLSPPLAPPPSSLCRPLPPFCAVNEDDFVALAVVVD